MQGSFQYLKHGKALCGKAAPRFVETFNHLVDFTKNIKGDADIGKEGGRIHVDRTDPDNPVIRFSEGEGCGGEDDEPTEQIEAAEGSGLVVNDCVLDLDGRQEGQAFAVRKLTVKAAKEDEEDREYQILGTEDVEIEATATGVEKLNGETGALEIAGGHKVNVSKEGKTITISLDEGKPDPQRDPNTNCDDHPGSQEGGGVDAVDAGSSGPNPQGGVPVPTGRSSEGVGCGC